MRFVPRSVLLAQLVGDRVALSRFGRLGATRRREIRQAEKIKKEEMLAGQLRECEQIAHEAHEDICPVDD